MLQLEAWFTVDSRTPVANWSLLFFLKVSKTVLNCTLAKKWVLLQKYKQLMLFDFSFYRLWYLAVYFFTFIQRFIATLLKAFSWGKIICLSGYVGDTTILAESMRTIRKVKELIHLYTTNRTLNNLIIESLC